MNQGHGQGYEKPTVTDHGTLTELTAGQAAGVSLDNTFPQGTPVTDLTFS